VREMPLGNEAPSAEPLPALIDSSMLISLKLAVVQVSGMTCFMRQQQTACLTEHLTLLPNGCLPVDRFQEKEVSPLVVSASHDLAKLLHNPI
jgi:hypothetical protein